MVWRTFRHVAICMRNAGFGFKCLLSNEIMSGPAYHDYALWRVVPAAISGSLLSGGAGGLLSALSSFMGAPVPAWAIPVLQLGAGSMIAYWLSVEKRVKKKSGGGAGDARRPGRRGAALVGA